MVRPLFSPPSKQPQRPEWATNEATAVRVWVRPERRPTWLGRLFRSLLIWIVLLGASAGAGVSIWISALLILRPHPPQWLASALPYWTQSWSNTPAQSLANIQAELQSSGQAAGALIDLTQPGTDPSLARLYLLPILPIPSSCSRSCEDIQAIRLYRAGDRRTPEAALYLLDELTIAGPSENHIIDPVTHPELAGFTSTTPLPLIQIKSLPGPLSGHWLTLTGRWQNRGRPVLYGQVLHVDPHTLRINSLLNWYSPAGRLPTWQPLDGDDFPELVIDQSVGLEPTFKAYTIASTLTAAVNTRLVEVSLLPEPLPSPSHRTQYSHALFLAQQGLWSASYQRLDQLKSQLAEQWSARLERQLQLTQLHQRVSQQQAEREWPRIGYKLLALLLDGQWQPALETLQTTQQEAIATLPVLEQNFPRLWQRITAALEVDSRQTAARLWGAVMLMAKGDEKSAQQWLSQDADQALAQEFNAIAALLVPPTPSPAAIARSPQPLPQSESSPQPLAGLFGVAQRLATLVPADWHRSPEIAALTLPANHQWYEISLQAGYVGSQWQPTLSPPAISTHPDRAPLWQWLNLTRQPALNLVPSEAHAGSVRLKVHALRWRQGKLSLLASGLTVSQGAEWPVVTGHLNRAHIARMMPLPQFVEENSVVGDRLVTAITDYLPQPTLETQASIPNPLEPLLAAVTLQKIGEISNAGVVYLLHLPAEQPTSPEVAAAPPAPAHILINEQGSILYSGNRNGIHRPIVGWTTPEQGAIALIVQTEQTYTLQSWSPTANRFQ